jgi:hypothetical protein
MYKDDLIIADLYLENAQVSNLNEDQQKKLASFIVNLVVKSEQGDQEALRILNMSPDEIAGMMSQGETVQTEAFENIRSKVGGFLSGTGSIQKRYEFLKKNLSKILWELGEDIKTTRSEEAIGKYDNLANSLKQIDPTLVPEGGTFQKAAYSVGKGVGTVGKVLAGGLLAKSLLTIGLPAMAVGGIMGGVLNVLKNAQNTQMTPAEKIKRALSAAGLGVMIGFAMGELRDLIGGDPTASTEDGASTPENNPSGEKNDFSTYIEGDGITIDQSDESGVTVTVKERINTGLGDARGEIIARRHANLRADLAISEILGDDTVRGIVTKNVEIPGDGYVYTTRQWTPEMSSAARGVAETMSRSMID